VVIAPPSPHVFQLQSPHGLQPDPGCGGSDGHCGNGGLHEMLALAQTPFVHVNHTGQQPV
jgi:hypothetical protein